MNKYNIEVGDKLGEDAITFVDSKGVSFNKGQNVRVTIYTWEYINPKIDNKEVGWELTKMNKAKIIGYKLLNNSNKQAVFDILDIDHFGEDNYPGVDIELKHNIKKLKDANILHKWFEPIYETKLTEVYVDTLAGKVKVTKVAVVLNQTAEEAISIIDFDKIARNIRAYNMNVAKAQRASSRAENYLVQVDTFKVGCKTFNIKDLDTISEAIKQVS